MKTRTQIIIVAVGLLIIFGMDKFQLDGGLGFLLLVTIPTAVLALILGLKALYFAFCYLMNTNPHGFGPWPESPRPISRLDRGPGVDQPEGAAQTPLLEERKQQVWDCVVAEWLTQAEIRERIGGNQGLTAKAVRSLHEEGRLERIGGGKKGDPYRYFAFFQIAASDAAIGSGEKGDAYRDRTIRQSAEGSSKDSKVLAHKAGRLWASLSATKRAAIGLGSIVLLGIIVFAIANSGKSNTDRNTTTSSSYPSPTTASPAPFPGSSSVAGELSSDLFNAASDGNADEVISLLNRGANINSRAADMRTPLFDAVSGGIGAHLKGGHLDAVRALLERGADVNARHQEGFTALLWAVMGKGEIAIGIANLLVANGADVNARDNEGESPLTWAKKHRRRDMVQILSQAKQNQSVVSVGATQRLPVLGEPGNPTAILHRDYVRRLPLARTLEDMYDLEEAIQSNRDLEAFAMMQRGRFTMIPNDSEIEVLDTRLLHCQVKVRKTGKVGWVLCDWVREK